MADPHRDPDPRLPQLWTDEDEESILENGVCAMLTPYDHNAVCSFDSVVNAILAQPDKYVDVRKRVRLFNTSPVPIEDALSLQNIATDNGAESASSAATAPITSATTEPVRKVWHGAFVLSYRQPPSLPSLGWRLGYGPHPQEYQVKADLPLHVGPESSLLRIHQTSARINVLLQSPCCTIIAGHNDGTVKRSGEILDTSEPRTLSKDREIIQVGQLAYEFRYLLRDSEPNRAIAHADYVKTSLGAQEPVNKLASATPSPCDINIGKWRILKRAGQGTQGTVNAAMLPNGELFAVKRYEKRLQHVKEDTLPKLEALRTRTSSPYIQRLFETIEPGGSSDSIYLFFTPLAHYDLATMLSLTWKSAPPSHDDKLSIFAQLLLGIQALHKASFIHDDLKPANIAIKSVYPKPKIVILDLDSIKEFSSNSTKCFSLTAVPCGGTIGYLAPERESSASGGFGTPVDIWSAGCIGIELFFSKPLQAKSVGFNPFRDWKAFPANLKLERARPHPDQVRAEVGRLETFLDTLVGDEVSITSVEGLLGLMLEIDPAERATADEALDHACLGSSLMALRAVESKTGEKRERESESDES